MDNRRRDVYLFFFVLLNSWSIDLLMNDVIDQQRSFFVCCCFSLIEEQTIVTELTKQNIVSIESIYFTVEKFPKLLTKKKFFFRRDGQTADHLDSFRVSFLIDLID